MSDYPDSLDIAEFNCWLPDIQSAIKAGGEGMRFQFQVHASGADFGQATKLIGMKRKRLRARIWVEDDKGDGRVYGER